MRSFALALPVLVLVVGLGCEGAPAPAPAPAPDPAAPEARPSDAEPPSAPSAPSFAALATGHVEGCACAYDFAPGSGLAGRAFEHDGDQSWMALEGRGDVAITRVPADGSFGGASETFALPDGGELRVDHDGRRMVLTTSGGTVSAAIEGGCGC